MQNGANECQIQELMEQVQEKTLQSKQLRQMEVSRNSLVEKLHGQQSQLRSIENELETVKLELAGKKLHWVEGDQLRSEAGEVVRDMLTGDSFDVANNVQRKLGPIDVPTQLFPKDKVELLKQLKPTGLTGMVGDGINDAPALVAADVGIAMGVAVVGYASLWGAVLADVVTCLLVIFDSIMLLERKKDESGCLGLFAFRRKCRSKVYQQKDVLLSSEKGANNGMRQRVNNRDACEKDCQCIAIDEGLLVSSDAADVGREVRDSLLGGSSEGDVESVSQEWDHSKESGQMDVIGRSNLDLGPLAHLGVWALKFASVQSYKHFIAEFQNCSFNNTYLLEATEENKIKVLGKEFGGWAKTKEADDSVWEDAKDGSETPFFSEKDFKEAFSVMASRENLANFDSFPSSEERPFKFNMIGNFGQQKVCTDSD
ncbi:hypothetical protein L7F22_036097 [Adiantum nelumboides]|nr:hypothetical protein [Adiantum nelumboides]